MLLWACWCIILCWVSDYFLMLNFNIQILSISCAHGLNSLTVLTIEICWIFFHSMVSRGFLTTEELACCSFTLKVFHDPFQYSFSGRAYTLGQGNEHKSGILYKWWWWEGKLYVHALLCVGTIGCMHGCVWMQGFMYAWLCMSTAVCVYAWVDIPVFTGSHLMDLYELWGC